MTCNISHLENIHIHVDKKVDGRKWICFLCDGSEKCNLQKEPVEIFFNHGTIDDRFLFFPVTGCKACYEVIVRRTNGVNVLVGCTSAKLSAEHMTAAKICEEYVKNADDVAKKRKAKFIHEYGDGRIVLPRTKSAQNIFTKIEELLSSGRKGELLKKYEMDFMHMNFKDVKMVLALFCVGFNPAMCKQNWSAKNNTLATSAYAKWIGNCSCTCTQKCFSRDEVWGTLSVEKLKETIDGLIARDSVAWFSESCRCGVFGELGIIDKLFYESYLYKRLNIKLHEGAKLVNVPANFMYGTTDDVESAFGFFNRDESKLEEKVGIVGPFGKGKKPSNRMFFSKVAIQCLSTLSEICGMHRLSVRDATLKDRETFDACECIDLEKFGDTFQHIQSIHVEKDRGTVKIKWSDADACSSEPPTPLLQKKKRLFFDMITGNDSEKDTCELIVHKANRMNMRDLHDILKKCCEGTFRLKKLTLLAEDSVETLMWKFVKNIFSTVETQSKIRKTDAVPMRAFESVKEALKSVSISTTENMLCFAFMPVEFIEEIQSISRPSRWCYTTKGHVFGTIHQSKPNTIVTLNGQEKRIDPGNESIVGCHDLFNFTLVPCDCLFSFPKRKLDVAICINSTSACESESFKENSLYTLKSALKRGTKVPPDENLIVAVNNVKETKAIGPQSMTEMKACDVLAWMFRQKISNK